MKDGIVRVGAITPDARVANPVYNGASAAEAATRAEKKGVKVLVFPELTLSGYACSDLFFQKKLLACCEQALADYIEATKGLDLISFIGLPVAFRDKIYNCAAAVSGGRLLGLVPKTNIPNYNEFYEARHFVAAPAKNAFVTYAGFDTLFGTDLIFETDAVPGLRIAAEICEDLWVPAPPSTRHALAGATLIVNLSASDELVGKAEYRRDLVAMQSAKTVSAMLYADAGKGESGTDMVFAAHNLLAENGRVLAESLPFADDSLIYGEIDTEKLVAERRKMTTFVPSDAEGYEYIGFDLKSEETVLTNPPPRFPFVPSAAADRRARCELILNIQSRGLAGRIERAHAKAAVLGLSGGLDSTLALLVAVRAIDLLGRDRKEIVAVTMPAFGTTARTKGNAERLAEAFGVTLKTIDIRRAVEVHFEDIGHAKDNFDVVYENSQARERTQVLMDIANAEGGIVIGTGDLSELALGWATYNGDHMSMYAVNCSVPKTLVRYVVSTYADAVKKKTPDVSQILEDVLATPVSPELLPPKDGEIAQCTEGIVGPYELHDYFLYHFVRFGFTPKKIYRLALATYDGIYDKETVLGWLKVFVRRFFAQQFKRSCLPDGPKVGSVSLSPRADWRMPSDAEVAVWLAELDEVNA